MRNELLEAIINYNAFAFQYRSIAEYLEQQGKKVVATLDQFNCLVQEEWQGGCELVEWQVKPCRNGYRVYYTAIYQQ